MYGPGRHFGIHRVRTGPAVGRTSIKPGTDHVRRLSSSDVDITVTDGPGGLVTLAVVGEIDLNSAPAISDRAEAHPDGPDVLVPMVDQTTSCSALGWSDEHRPV